MTSHLFSRRSVVAGAGAAVAARAIGPSVLAVKQEGNSVKTAGPIEVVVSGYDSPEGPAFDKEGNLFFVNWLTSSVVKVAPDGTASEFFNTRGIPAGLAFHPDGSLYVADEGDDIHGLLRITPDGKGEILVNTFEGKPLNGANDLVFDKGGVLYFSDPWGSFESPIGGFYRFFPDGGLEQLDTGLGFPNGVALTADGSAVVLAETAQNRLLRYDIASDGTVGPRTVWAVLDSDPGPDGMAFDAEGNLYVAQYGTGAINVFGPDGALLTSIAMPMAETTNCAFGGPENRTLYVTSVGAQSVYRVEMTVPGQPLYDGRVYT